MKKIVKFLYVVSILTGAVFLILNSSSETLWNNYYVFSFSDSHEVHIAETALHSQGYERVLTEASSFVDINTLSQFTAYALTDIPGILDPRDYRYDPFVKSMSGYFSVKNSGDPLLYVYSAEKNIRSFVKLIRIFIQNDLSFFPLTPVRIRAILQFFTAGFIAFILGVGCRKRFVFSLLFFTGFFFLALNRGFGFFSGLMIFYLMGIILIEKTAFSNRYIKRNNLGTFRYLIVFMSLFIPTLFGEFYQTETIIPSRGEVAAGFTYDDMESLYNKDAELPGVSEYFTHFAFQKDLPFGNKYLFPSNNNSVTMDKFRKEGYALVKRSEVVRVNDSSFLNSFLEYCNKSNIGSFFMEQQQPFRGEFRGFSEIYSHDYELYILLISVFLLTGAAVVFRKKHKRY